MSETWKTYDGLVWRESATFAEAMEKHFEGWNPPRRVTEDGMEAFCVAHERVCRHYADQSAKRDCACSNTS